MGRVDQAARDLKRAARSCRKLSVLGFTPKRQKPEDNADSGIYLVYWLSGLFNGWEVRAKCWLPAIKCTWKPSFRPLSVVPFPSLDLLCGTVCRLNFGSSTVVLHFVDGWSHITFNWLLTNYFINFYNARLFLSTVYVNGALQIIIIIIIIIV